MSKMFRSLIVLVILGTLLVGVLPASGAPPAPDSLSQAARGALTITRDLATGAVAVLWRSMRRPWPCPAPRSSWRSARSSATRWA